MFQRLKNTHNFIRWMHTVQRLQQSISYVQCIAINQKQKWRTELLLSLLTMNVNRIVSLSTKLLLLRYRMKMMFTAYDMMWRWSFLAIRCVNWWETPINWRVGYCIPNKRVSPPFNSYIKQYFCLNKWWIFTLKKDSKKKFTFSTCKKKQTCSNFGITRKPTSCSLSIALSYHFSIQVCVAWAPKHAHFYAIYFSQQNGNFLFFFNWIQKCWSRFTKQVYLHNNNTKWQ